MSGNIDAEDQQEASEIEQEMEEDNEEGSQFSEDFQSDPEEDINQIQGQENQQLPEVAVVKNPVSPYMIFVSKWKQLNPGEKLKISAMGEAWKALTQSQKSVYEEQYKDEKKKYDSYIAHMMSIDPNFKSRAEKGKNYLFPLHRVKAIMKQDSEYKAGAEAVATMSKTVQFFGEFLLQEIKKHTQGKKRIEHNDLFETINTNQSNLWFLECLIDEHNENENQGSGVKKDTNEKQEKKEKKEKKVKSQKPQEKEKKVGRKAAQKKIPKGQMKLTDMF